MRPIEMILAIMRDPPPFFTEPEKWSSGFTKFVKRCLVRDPEQRFSTSDALNDPFIHQCSCQSTDVLRSLIKK